MATTTTKKAAPAKKAAPRKAAAPRSAAAAKPQPEVQHPLAHLVPDMMKADEYVSRLINGVRDITLLRYAKAAGRHVLLSGPTGLGKSHLVEAFCATDKLPLVVIEAKDGIDTNTFFGGYVPKESADVDTIMDVYNEVSKKMPRGTSPEVVMQVTMNIVSQTNFEYVYSDVVRVLDAGDGVVFIDEVNFMRPKVSATFHRVMRESKYAILEKGNELHHCGPNVLIVAAYNDGYEGTYPLNQAFRNRFAIKASLEYDTAVEKELLAMPSTLKIAKKLRDVEDIESPVSTNLLASSRTSASTWESTSPWPTSWRPSAPRSTRPSRSGST